MLVQEVQERWRKEKEVAEVVLVQEVQERWRKEKEVGASEVGVLEVKFWRRITRKLAVVVVFRCHK